ncbi:hypothetical protein [Streptomyces humicola]|uniref:hypothetical protein n=1 Tax=Streptomyces humicola TaxID=2953240 RepID=UPI0035590D4A
MLAPVRSVLCRAVLCRAGRHARDPYTTELVRVPVRQRPIRSAEQARRDPRGQAITEESIAGRGTICGV